MQTGWFAEVIYAICKLYGGSVTSWVRSRSHNKKVGGLERSFHILGLGVDIVLDERTPERVQSIVDHCKLYGLQVIDETTHIHIEPAPESFPGKGGVRGGQNNGNS